MYYKIALLSPPYSVYTYALPKYIPEECITKGLRVAVPLGNGALRVGVVLEKVEEHGLLEGTTIKNIVWLLEKKPLLSTEIISLVENLSIRQAQEKAQIFANILPQAFRTTSKLRLKEYKEKARPSLHSFTALKTYTEEQCTSLFQEFFFSDKVELIELAQDKSAHEMCRLLKDPPWNIRPRAQKQREILEYLYNHGETSLKHLNSALGNIRVPLETLIKLGFIGIVPYDGEDYEEEENIKNLALLESTLLSSNSFFDFSHDQEKAIESGKDIIKARQAELRLLYGITGSGKTAVYLELTKQSLLSGLCVFLLAPEIALALKLKKDVEKYLPHIKIYFSHGYQSPIKRARIYKAIAQDEQPYIIIGTRSALFHSLHEKQKIGFIALDEEHDASYKQEEKISYHAKEIAWFRASKNKALMLIGSATPDIKSFYSAQKKQIKCDTLSSRVGGGNLPQVELVEIPKKSDGLLTPYSLNALKECLERNEQAVILLNRRGYAPVLYCLDCKKVQTCPHCSIALTYHKKREVLTCHYCNYARPFPSPCSECRSMNFLPLGDGTERLEEELNTFLQVHALEKKILRLDRDSTRRIGSTEEILALFSRGEASILVGTQMLSKGHHFPAVSLAIIADADLTLNFPDYRAAERTFQLLVQSAGRAGRELENSKVLIQTRDTKHYCWQYVQQHDYENFYAYELALREKRQYPPFIKLALIRISLPQKNTNYTENINQLKHFMKEIAKECGVKLLGPIVSPIAVIQNIRRYQCLLKADDWKKIRHFFYTLQKLQTKQSNFEEMRLSLDIDPINML